MTYELNVNTCKEKHSLIPNWFIGFFVLAIIIVSVLIFPEKLLLYQALHSEQNQPVAIYYLTRLTAMYPHNTALKLALVRQEIDQYKWSLAESNLDQLEKIPALKVDTALLRFRLDYTKAFQTTNIKAQQQQFESLKKELPDLAKLSLNKSQLLYLATLALSINDGKTALAIYLRMGSTENITDPVLLSNIGRAALGAEQYKIASTYYLKAAAHEKTLDKKRQDTIDALNALLAGNLLKEGIAVLQALPKPIWSNKAMLLFMTQYALSAGRPDLASAYVKRALLLHGI